MTRQVRLDLVRLQVPYLRTGVSLRPRLAGGAAHLERAVLARAHEHPAVRAPREPVHGADVPAERRDEAARAPVPHAHRAVPARARGPAAVGRERDVRHLALVAREPRERLLRTVRPEEERVVVRARDEQLRGRAKQ
jgi:hypothetical protein